MSERSPMRSDAGGSSETHHGSQNDSLDDVGGAAGNSIIGKVKSRVSSILPNSLSKWFSPSTKTNDSLNGSLLVSTTATANTRRRRRIELDDDEEDENEDMGRADEGDDGRYDENLRRDPVALGDDNSDDDDAAAAAEDDDEESNNSEEDLTTTDPAGGLQSRRTLNVAAAGVRIRQPPKKRSRFSLDLTSKIDNSLLSRLPLVASTPAMGGGSSNLRGFSGSMSNPPSVLVPTRTSAQHYTHLNLYGGGQQQQDKKETGYNLFATSNREVPPSRGGNFMDLTLQQQQQTNDRNAAQGCSAYSSSGMSSRRSLNIPSTLQNPNELMYTGGLSHLKRQSLATLRSDLPSTSAGIAPIRTSTTILEIEDDDDDVEEVEETAVDESEATKYNGRNTVAAAMSHLTHKRPKLINGGAGGANLETEVAAGTNADAAGHLAGDDSASEESSEGGAGRNEPIAGRKTGLFNMSGAKSRSGSRHSSFGNGLNFYSHLEGRKSLFAGGQGLAGGISGNASAMNNSTLSLTSLNRRQFNASIYGSTSALSDSRLLNTFSPFYKGRTTYGGAAAYNKYASSAGSTGAGASAVRLTPTLIRPTSSLSTLSSSSNSLAAAGGGIAGGENSSAISSTAKRILDLINDFATPLSEAKKMASNLKTQHHSSLSKSSTRLNESDLQATRALRLSQVRTPYMRPVVHLQPTHVNGKSAALPPIRELQVPSMSQLLQMKKMQSTTERSRQITTQNTTYAPTNTAHAVAVNPSVGEYSLPNAAAAQAAASNKASGGDWKQSPQQQQSSQKYTSKIKNKISGSVRITGSKDAAALAEANSPLPAVNLPNIAFPLMQSVPKINITLPGSTSPAARTELKFGAASTIAFNSSNNNKTATKPSSNIFNTTSSPPSKVITGASLKNVTTNFKFSAPLELKEGLSHTPTNTQQEVTPINSSNYKFSPPTLLTQVAVVTSATVKTTPPNSKPTLPQTVAGPQLKTGSVLDALKKQPLSAAPATTFDSFASSPTTSFGNQFKKSSGEWECDACMVRNQQIAVKCVACTTTRKSPVVTNVQVMSCSTHVVASNFGTQFKKSSSEWECEACMVRNKQDAVKCIACMTPHKDAATVSAGATTAPPVIKNSFGDAFKPKSNTWECNTCLVNNKADCDKCIACQTSRPGAPTPAPAPVAASGSTFKFGFANTSAAAVTKTAADVGFKTLAAEQKASKWECEACMTHNDAARIKCVCCEQAKPGTQTVSETVPKFAFGATAAAKFSFGFGAANAPKETELRQQEVNAAATTTQKAGASSISAAAPTGFTFGVGVPKAATTDAAKPAAGGSFTFGIKSAAVASTDASKDVTDNNNTKPKETGGLVGFKFGTTPAAAVPATSTAPVAKGLVFGTAKSTETASSATSTTKPTTNSPSVKFSLPTAIQATTSAETAASSETVKTAATAPSATFSFGSPAAATKPSSGGFSFGAASPQQSSKTDSIAPATALGGFAFKTPATAVSTTAAVVASSTNTSNTFGMPLGDTASAATANKPIFGASASTPASAATSTVVAGGFSFGASSSVSTSATPPPAVKSLFGAAAAPTTVAAPPPAFNSSPTASSLNMFGSPSTGAANPSAPPVFGAAPKKVAPAAVSTASSPFGSFGAGGGAATNTNVFGTVSTKPTATATPFGNATNNSATAPTAASTPFLFGSPSSSSTNSNSAVAASTTTWSKNNFVFGGAAAGSAAAPNTMADTANAAAKSANVFGSFGATQTSASVPSMFGAPTPAAAAVAPQSVFGSASTSSTAIFGSNSAPPAVASSTNLFSSAAPSGSNATAPPPAFGSSPFGGSTVSATPTFGSAAAAPTTFGSGFGSAASAAASSSVSDGASAAKKSDPSVFSFGAAPTAGGATQTTSGGFNFGAPAAKPAFNFAQTNQPAFNFTGTAEQTQTMTTTATTATPFQFGATPSAPVFNFSSGAVETTPNAPFQFNAGATPASSNIFAPQLTPGAPQSGQQQARRKIRAPIRRQTPR